MWSELPLPIEIPLNTRLFIRASQLLLFEKMRNDNSYILKDIDMLLNYVTHKEKLGVIYLAISHLKLFSFSKLNTFYRYITKVLELNNSHDELPIEIEMKHHLNIESFDEIIFSSLFFALNHIKTHQDLLNWIKIIEKIPSESVPNLLNNKHSIVSFVQLCNKLWMSESDKSEKDRNWDRVLSTLLEIEEKAHELNLDILWYSSVRAQIIVLAEYLDSFEKAIHIGCQALNNISKANKVGEYLIKQIIASEFYYKDEYIKADLWFSEVNTIDLEISALYVIRLYSYLYHSVALFHFDKNRALAQCEKAVNFAEKYINSVSTNLLIMALGELTIQKFNTHGLNETFDLFERGIEILLNSDKKNSLWKNLAYSFGRLGVYLSNIYQHYTNKTNASSEILPLLPTPGSIISGGNTTNAAYDPIKDSFIFSQFVSIFAERIGNDEKALKWGLLAYRHFQEAGSPNYTLFFYILAGIVIPNLIVGNKFIEAVNLTEKMLSANPIQDEKIIEFAIYSTIIPIFFYLGCCQNANQIMPINLKATIDGFQDVSWKMKKVNINLWSSIIKLFRVIFLDENDNINKLEENFSENEKKVFSILAILGRSMKKNVLPEYALQIHREIHKSINGFYFNKYPYLFRTIVFPFFRDYWKNKFNNFRFRFRSPENIAEDLKRVFESSSKDALEKMFNIIERGLK